MKRIFETIKDFFDDKAENLFQEYMIMPFISLLFSIIAFVFSVIVYCN